MLKCASEAIRITERHLSRATKSRSESPKLFVLCWKCGKPTLRSSDGRCVTCYMLRAVRLIGGMK